MEDVSVVDPQVVEAIEQLKWLVLLPIEGVTYEDQVVFLDGRAFTNCSFIRCEMTILLGRFALTGTTNISQCSWRLSEVAKGTVELLDYVRAGGDLQGPVQ